MRDYFIRRLLLIPVTLLGITMILFAITRAVPGGPLEQRLMEMQQMDMGSGSRSTGGSGMALSEAQLEEMKKYYGFDKPTHIAYLNWLGNVVQGDFGKSHSFNEPVIDVISERFKVSIFYGLITLCLTYGICIPLGILKAIKHRTWIDNASSLVVFTGYAIPGYALGALLLLVFSARLEWFPMGGFTSFDFYDLSFFGKIKDLFHHAALPLICYMVGSFAFTTLLMKNHLLDNLSADYVRTAIAKGVSFKSAVFKHAFRNSLIPIATTFGQNITLLVTGSFLIEFIFDIDGFGLLGLSSILTRDYPVVMGIVFLSSLLLLIGNVISDALVALIDPRIRFE